MKKLFSILSFLIINQLSYAKFPIVTATDLSGDYNDNRGVAYAETARYDLTEAIISHNRISIEFFRPSKNLVLRDDNTTVELNFDVSFMNVFKAFNFNRLNLNSSVDVFNLDCDRLVLDIEPAKYTINKLQLESNVKGKVGKEEEYSLLDGFLISGEVNIKSIFFGLLAKDEFISLMKEDNPEVKDQIEADFKPNKNLPVTARNLRLVVEKGNFSGSVFLDSWLNATLYLGGKVDLNIQESKLVINLWKARVGYFSIRNIILRKVAALNLDAVSVSGSAITIDLGKKKAKK